MLAKFKLSSRNFKDVHFFTYTEDGDEPVHRWYLKTSDTCEVSRAKKCNIEQDHLESISLSFYMVEIA